MLFFWFSRWSRVLLALPISPRDSSSTKKSPSLGNKSCQAQYRNLLSVVMCARFTFELWILISSPCLMPWLAPSTQHSCRFLFKQIWHNLSAAFSPLFYPSANQLNLSILCVNFRSKRLWIFFGRQLWVAWGLDPTNITWFIGRKKLAREIASDEGERAAKKGDSGVVSQTLSRSRLKVLIKKSLIYGGTRRRENVRELNPLQANERQWNSRTKKGSLTFFLWIHCQELETL